VAYFVVGYDIIGEKQEKGKTNNIVETPFNNIQIMPFEEMWENYVIPLSGKTISTGTLTNRIVSVDWQGITRQTSTGRIGKIAINDFEFAYNQLAQHGYVEREFINQHANRCSSGIVLILSQVPFIEVKDKPRKALYVKTSN
jgi:restriction system protein